MTVKVVEAVIDVVVVSVPTTLTVYVPLAALVEAGVWGDAELWVVPVHPDAAKPITANRQRAAIAPANRLDLPARQKDNSAANIRPAMALNSAGNGDPRRWVPVPNPATIPAAPQEDEAVCTARTPVTALLPEIRTLGSAKQPFDREGLLVTVHEIVPVYPFWGVTVTVEEPELPAATVTFEAVRVNDLASTVTVWLPLEAA